MHIMSNDNKSMARVAIRWVRSTRVSNGRNGPDFQSTPIIIDFTTFDKSFLVLMVAEEESRRMGVIRK